MTRALGVARPDRLVRLRRAEQVEQNRAVVLAAAQRVFGARGYLAATLEHIAEEAGFSKGVVYSQFGSKADLFLAVLELRIAERAAEHRSALAAADDEDDIRAVTEALNAIMLSSDPAWRLAVVEFRVVAARDPQLRERYATVHRTTIERLSALLDELYERTGDTPAVTTEELSIVLLGLDAGVLLEDTVNPRPVPATTVHGLVHRLVFGREPAAARPPERRPRSEQR